MNNTIHTVRVITDHAIDPANESLTITVLDAPGNGGASHLYRIMGFDSMSNACNRMVMLPGDSATGMVLFFQNGPIPEVGVNGITIEALLAIVADRLHGFQSGPYACEENERALLLIKEAMDCLMYRTRDRIKRGVEGTYKA